MYYNIITYAINSFIVPQNTACYTSMVMKFIKHKSPEKHKNPEFSFDFLEIHFDAPMLTGRYYMIAYEKGVIIEIVYCEEQVGWLREIKGFMHDELDEGREHIRSSMRIEHYYRKMPLIS